jgi:hypothetical protein
MNADANTSSVLGTKLWLDLGMARVSLQIRGPSKLNDNLYS